MVAPSHGHYYWPMKMGRTARWSLIALVCLLPFLALEAQTDEIQVYTGEVETPGKANLTIHVNYTPRGRPVARQSFRSPRKAGAPPEALPKVLRNTRGRRQYAEGPAGHPRFPARLLSF